MTWLGQVRHVFVKDVRQARWLIVAYIVIVAIATLRAVESPLVGYGGFAFAPAVVLLIGALLIAGAVQFDSPIRNDAFWKAHPLRPISVATAKLMFAVVVVAIGLAGQAVALAELGVPGALLPSLLVRAVSPNAAWMLATLLIAAITPDLRTFVLSIVAFLFLTVAGVLLLPDSVVGGPVLTVTIVRLVGATLGIAVLLWLFRRRDTPMLERLASGAAAVVTLVTMMAAVPAAKRAPGDGAFDRPMLGLQLTGDSLRATGSALQVMIVADSVTMERRHVLHDAALVVEFDDGSRMRVPVTNLEGDLQPMTAIYPRIDGVRWIGQSRDRSIRRQINAPVSPVERRRLQAGVAGIVLEGRIAVLEPRLRDTVPLAVGSEAVGPRGRVGVVDWTHEFGEVAVTLRTRLISEGRTAADDLRFWGNGTVAALVNPVRREAMMLDFRGAEGGDALIVLPGAPLVNRTHRYEGTVPPGSLTTATEDAWFRGARVEMYELERSHDYPVRLELSLR